MALSGPDWGGRGISRMCLHSNICDSILIFVPNMLGAIKLDCCLWPCRALSGDGGRISRMCFKHVIQSNICDSIVILVPNILGVIKVDCCLWPSWALSGGEGTISGMCEQSNIFYSIHIFRCASIS